MSTAPQAPMSADDPSRYFGFMGLSRMLLNGADPRTIRLQLVKRVHRDPGDAYALLDLATLLFMLTDLADRRYAFSLQEKALALRQLYHPHAAQPQATLRLLALYGPGDMTANTPLDCLLEGSDVEILQYFVAPGQPVPTALPEHDAVFVAIGESDESRPLLERAAAVTALSGKLVFNAVDRVAQLGREQVSAKLGRVPGICMPATIRSDRSSLERVARGERPVSGLHDKGAFPLIIRPIGSHGGKDLARAGTTAELTQYLDAVRNSEFYVSRFVDYSGTDGLFRKVRVALVDGVPYASHLAISQNWIVHYMNAGMFDSAEKRAEEQRFFENFDRQFARKHEKAMRHVYDAIGLDYVGIDCAETTEGELLIFEVDSAMIVHDMDSAELFPYKPAQMKRIFAAFRAMLNRATRR
jgi:glutathione synthase/RimK-type ligase-like ATP-grasp enzyme